MVTLLMSYDYKSVSLRFYRYMSSSYTYVHPEVRVQQHLELEALVTLVLDVQHRLQTVFEQRYTVHECEVIWPCLL